MEKWRTKTIEIDDDYKYGTIRIERGDNFEMIASNNNKILIISQETNNLISGYTNNEEAVIKEKPIIAFGDHTLSVKYIDFDFCYGADGMNTKIDTKLFSYILKNRLKEIDDKKYLRHFSKLKLLKFELPLIQTKQQLLQQINQIEKENEELKSEAEVLEQQKKEFLDKYLK